jgi:hypothetical protein
LFRSPHVASPTTPVGNENSSGILINNADLVEAVEVAGAIQFRRKGAPALHLRTDGIASNKTDRRCRMTIEVVAGSGVGNGEQHVGQEWPCQEIQDRIQGQIQNRIEVCT